MKYLKIRPVIYPCKKMNGILHLDESKAIRENKILEEVELDVEGVSNQDTITSTASTIASYNDKSKATKLHILKEGEESTIQLKYLGQ